MAELSVTVGSRSLAIRIGELIAEARGLAGWSQRELACRAATTQTAVSRIERGVATSLDLQIVERLLDALGLRATLAVEGRHLHDRRRQAEPVHARLNGFVAGQLGRRSFLTALEAQIGEPVPRGWIDLLAYRPAGRSLVVEETKGDLPDMGGFQRSLAFYERSSLHVAHRLGWRPTRVVVLATLLDSETVAGRVRENRELLAHAFPSPVRRVPALGRRSGGDAAARMDARDGRSGQPRGGVAAPDGPRRPASCLCVRELRRCGGPAAGEVPAKERLSRARLKRPAITRRSARQARWPATSPKRWWSDPSPR